MFINFTECHRYLKYIKYNLHKKEIVNLILYKWKNDKDMFRFFNEFIFFDQLKVSVDVKVNDLRKYFINRFHETIPPKQNINNTITFRRCHLKTT